LQYIHFSTRTSTQRTDPATRTVVPITVNDDTYTMYTYVAHDGLACSLVTDAEYPKSPAIRILDEQMGAFRKQHPGWDKVTEDRNIELGFLKPVLAKSVRDIDRLSKVTAKVDSVKEIMYKNIEDALGRGEKLDELLDKSKDLEKHAKKFEKMT